MPLTRAGGAAAVLLAVAPAASQSPPLEIEHAPPACFIAEKSPRLIACLAPRSSRADVRVLFRAGDGPWYRTALRYEMPCYRGGLPRPSPGTPSVSYVIEAQGAGIVARSTAFGVPVAPDAAACSGPAAPLATGPRATWEAPPGAPKTPAGFEGSRLGPAPSSQSAPANEPVPSLPAAVPRAEPVAERPRPTGGHGLRNAAIVLGGAAAAGGAAVAIRSGGDRASPPSTTGSGLPATGVAGAYVGTETITYGGGCTGTDDVVLNLQQSGPALSGVLVFTVRSCPCCAAGRGSSPVSGFLADTRVELTTPVGFAYSGSFAGNRLAGSLTGPGGVTGTWAVEKR